VASAVAVGVISNSLSNLLGERRLLTDRPFIRRFAIAAAVVATFFAAVRFAGPDNNGASLALTTVDIPRDLSVATSPSAIRPEQIAPENGHLPVLQTPRFNAFTEIPNGIGNEADFVRIRPSTGNPMDNGENGIRNGLYTNELSADCNVGDQFDIRIYVDNGASRDYNGGGSGTAVAHDVEVLLGGDIGTVGLDLRLTGAITASNADRVDDDAVIHCRRKVKLRSVPGSFVSYGRRYGEKKQPNDSLVGKPFRIGSEVAGSGDVWADWNHRVLVVYRAEVTGTYA
jgi:hypothetical protein